MTWDILVTLWIIYQTVQRCRDLPHQCFHKRQLTASYIGTIAWGSCMLGALYMAGMYN